MKGGSRLHLIMNKATAISGAKRIGKTMPIRRFIQNPIDLGHDSHLICHLLMLNKFYKWPFQLVILDSKLI